MVFIFEHLCTLCVAGQSQEAGPQEGRQERGEEGGEEGPGMEQPTTLVLCRHGCMLVLFMCHFTSTRAARRKQRRQQRLRPRSGIVDAPFGRPVRRHGLGRTFCVMTCLSRGNRREEEASCEEEKGGRRSALVTISCWVCCTEQADAEEKPKVKSKAY